MKVCKLQKQCESRSAVIRRLATQIDSFTPSDHLEFQSRVPQILPPDDETKSIYARVKRGYINETIYRITCAAKRALHTAGVHPKTVQRLLAAIRKDMATHENHKKAFRYAQSGGRNYLAWTPKTHSQLLS